MSIIKHTLLNVDGAAIIAKFNEYPMTQDNPLYQIAGIARLIQVEKRILPVVLIFPKTNKTTLEHECIHLCQWLNNQTYQLTLTERIALFEQNLEVVIKSVLSKHPEEALDLLIRSTCYKVWMELEAQYFTNAQHVILKRAQRSAMPFTTFERSLDEWGFYKDIPNAMAICSEKFPLFCAELESQVEWIRGLVAKSVSKTLSEALWWCKEDDETEMMFGPIKDWELEDQDEITRLIIEEESRSNLEDYDEDDDD